MSPILQRTFKISGAAGFPTEIYFKVIKMLKNRGYEVKKYKDWLEINPKSDLYQEFIRKRQSIEQNLGRVLSNVTDMRRDIELIKHDLRKFEQVVEHFDKKDLDSLKSDFVDLVESQTPTGMHQLVASGKFPTLVADFYKVESEEDIDKLKVSESEKGLLRTKWKLFQEWMDKYSKAVRERSEMLRKELNNRKAALKNQKELVEPYIKAVHKIKVGEGEYTGLDDPLVIESYNSVVSGVELSCWKPMSSKNVEPGEYYSYLEIKIKKKTLAAGGKDKESMAMDMELYLKKNKEIEQIEENIRKRDDLLWEEVEQLKGMKPIGEEKPEEKSQSRLEKIESAFNKILSKGKITNKGLKDELEEVIREDFIDFYDNLKDLIGGLKLKRH